MNGLAQNRFLYICYDLLGVHKRGAFTHVSKKRH
ncbi:hypothetical protein NK6_2497 [Bradyrhizobium diazoefficiens]|uniref:Uncharacterized protein n=1 Tax=Bradyrhizobium diazoefficiens TaxID=1355477 RepID=A0A0E4FU19_9BRAD|nr:hypothetical protein NK6_2497 [Bradyrhizobium diazoefficiens]